MQPRRRRGAENERGGETASFDTAILPVLAPARISDGYSDAGATGAVLGSRVFDVD